MVETLEWRVFQACENARSGSQEKPGATRAGTAAPVDPAALAHLLEERLGADFWRENSRVLDYAAKFSKLPRAELEKHVPELGPEPMAARRFFYRLCDDATVPAWARKILMDAQADRELRDALLYHLENWLQENGRAEPEAIDTIAYSWNAPEPVTSDRTTSQLRAQVKLDRVRREELRLKRAQQKVYEKACQLVSSLKIRQ